MTAGPGAAPAAATAPLSRRHKAAVLLLWLAALALALGVIQRTPFVADLSAFLPDRPDAGQQLLTEQLRSGVAARTLLLGIDGGSADQRIALSKALAGRLRDSGLFERVHNGETGAVADIGGWLFDHRYLLSPAVDAQRFGPDGLRDAIADTLSLLGTPAGNAFKPLLHRDPTGETQRIAEGLIPAQSPRSQEGVWVSRAAPRALMLLTTRGAGADLDAMAQAIARVRSEFAAAQAAAAAPGLELQLSGTPVFSVDSRAQIESEVKWLALSGAILISLLLLLAFGSLPALLVAMLPVITGVLTGIAVVGLGFGNVHGITLGFGATLIGEAVDYAIYYLLQARGGLRGAGQAGWRHWLRHSWPTVRLGLLTSICGFGALAFSGFPGLAQLGVFSMSGLLGAALTTRFLLPVLLPDGARGVGGVGARERMGRWAAAALGFMPRLRHGLLLLGLVAAAGLLWQRGQIWTADLASLSPVPRSAIELDASLRAELEGDEGGSLVVVQGADLETTLTRAEAVAARLDALVDAGQLAGYSSVTRWLPSQATQARRQASLPDRETLRAALTAATAGGPLKADPLQPFVDAVQAARALPPITPETLRGSAAAPLVEAMLMRRADGSWVTLMPLQAAAGAPASGPAAARAALQGLAGVQPLDVKPELDRLYQHYLGEAQLQAGLGAVAVLLLVALWLRSWRRLLAVCQPLLLAVVITLGGLALLQVPLGILHLVGLLLVVAVGSNYALFFDMLQQQSAADSDTLASLLLANLTTVLAFGLIALSDIPSLSAIGRVVAPGALLALVLAAALAPAATAARAARGPPAAPPAR